MKKIEQFKLDAKALANFLGEDNLVSVVHCQTRLRIVVDDFEKIQFDEIKKLDSVKGVFNKAGQLQIIIGVDVADFYQIFLTEVKINSQTSTKEKFDSGENNRDSSTSVKKSKENKVKHGNRFQRLMTVFSEIFIPLIPVIVAGGLILAFRNVLEIDWNGNGESSVDHVEFLASLDNWLWLPAEAVFWYLPVYVVWSMFNRKNKAPALGIAIGIMLIAPGTLVNLYSVSDALNNIFVPQFYVGLDEEGLLKFSSNPNDFINGSYTLLSIYDVNEQVVILPGVYTVADIATWHVHVSWSTEPIFLFPQINENTSNEEVVSIMSGVGIVGVYSIDNFFQAIDALDASYFTDFWPFAISYIGQVVPALLVGWFALWFYELVERHTISSVKYVWPPFITILVVEIVALGFIGPIGGILGFAISYTFNWAFSNPIAKYFFGPLFGLIYPVLVITGLHQTLNAVMLQLTLTNNNYIFPMLALSNMAQGAAVFAVVYMLKRDAKMREEGTSAGIACWLGVTEPAMYGVNLYFMFPFVAAMIGSSIGALFIVVFGITATGIGMGGVLGFLNINDALLLDISWIAMPLFILIMCGTVIWTFFITLLFSKKSKWFKKLTVNDWEEYVDNVNHNLKENLLKIEENKYEKIFYSNSQQFYSEYRDILSSYVDISYQLFTKENEYKKLSDKEEKIKQKRALKDDKTIVKILKKRIHQLANTQKKINKEKPNQ